MPLTAEGTGIFSQYYFYAVTDAATPEAPEDFIPEYWLHPADVQGVEPVSDPARLNGCCGLDGLDGPNMQCANCNAEVGTRKSDCWTADVFIPLGDATAWRDAPDRSVQPKL